MPNPTNTPHQPPHDIDIINKITSNGDKASMMSVAEIPKDQKLNKVFEFVNFYKPAAETNVKLAKKEVLSNNVNKENSFNSNPQIDAIRKGNHSNKKRVSNNNIPLDISTVGNIDNKAKSSSGTKKKTLNDFKVTSTPKSVSNSEGVKVKSIMKSFMTDHEETDDGYYNDPYQRKKRNKSVSFRLEDDEEVVQKKTKSGEPIKKKKEPKNNREEEDLIKELKKKKKAKEYKKNLAQNEPQAQEVEMEAAYTQTDDVKKQKTNKTKPDDPTDVEEAPFVSKEKKNKSKKNKKTKPKDSQEPATNESQVEGNPELKDKKNKKKKRKPKLSQSENEDEPSQKSRKTEFKPEIIAETLENLKIGDNPHTLTNLLDEMTVAGKNKLKKDKKNLKKQNAAKTITPSSGLVTELENIEEGKEKIKWKKRRWNKDRKQEFGDDSIATTIIIENLPNSIMLNYRKILTERFGQCGTIRKIGKAEVYPSEETKLVFTTSIVFDSEEAVTKALEEDNSVVEGVRVRVSRAQPATRTTLVARSFGELSEQALSSVLSAAGRIRRIRHLPKGRKAKASTSFVEFQDPDALERALKLAEDAKIGGKKIHVARFEVRTRRNNARDDLPKGDDDD